MSNENDLFSPAPGEEQNIPQPPPRKRGRPRKVKNENIGSDYSQKSIHRIRQGKDHKERKRKHNSARRSENDYEKSIKARLKSYPLHSHSSDRLFCVGLNARKK